MILYHGSNCDIGTIDLALCVLHKDFGRGFYLTPIRKHAADRARLKAEMSGSEAFVNVYEVPDDVDSIAELSVRRFDAVSVEWALFVMNNRRRDFLDIASLECNADNKYDIVIGPIANDRMARQFSLYLDGDIDLETLARKIEYRDFTQQYSIHTERALRLLQKVGIEHG